MSLWLPEFSPEDMHIPTDEAQEATVHFSHVGCQLWPITLSLGQVMLSSN